MPIPMPLADTLLRLAEPPALVQARWSDEILQDVTRTIEGRFGKSPQKARYRESAMRTFFPDSLVIDVKLRLEEQASAIGVSMELLLNRLGKLVPSFVSLLQSR